MRPVLFSLFAAVLLSTGCGSRAKFANPAGTLEATEVDIAATLSGRILEVRPKLGDAVAEGDTLVVLDTGLIALQRTQTEAGRASIAAQRRVADDALQQTKHSRELAATTLERTRTLLAQGSATQQQVDELQTKLDVAAAQVSAAKHQLDVLTAEETRLDAALAVYDRQLADGIVRAPHTGTVLLRKAEPGEVALPGAVLLRLANLDELELRIFLGEGELDLVQIGQELTVRVDALQGETLAGSVIWISSEAEFTPKNAQTRQARSQLVYAVKLRIANPDGRLHIGMPAEVLMSSGRS